jgi:hypothetical protein
MFYTTSQNHIPQTVREANEHTHIFPYVRRYDNRSDALANISQTGNHNVLLREEANGALAIDVALWDSR